MILICIPAMSKSMYISFNVGARNPPEYEARIENGLSLNMVATLAVKALLLDSEK